MAERVRRRNGVAGRTAAQAAGKAAGGGVKGARHLSQPGQDPYEQVEWDRRSAVILGEKGEVVFEQHDVEVPKAWSQLATNVVASKYFRGSLGTPQRGRRVRQLLGRVVRAVTAG